MKWILRPSYYGLDLADVPRETADYLESEDGRFVVNKAAVAGRLCYSAVRLGKRDRDSWVGSNVIHVEHVDPADAEARKAALARCKAACAAIST